MSRTNSRTQWKVIGRGKAGWHSDGVTTEGHKVSGSGGTLESYLMESDAGTLVYDATEADESAFIDWVYNGPMLDSTLLPGEVRRFMDQACLASMLPRLGGAFATIGALALVENKDNRIGSMDFVAIDIWLSLFRAKVPGVKFGLTNNKHEVIWE